MKLADRKLHKRLAALSSYPCLSYNLAPHRIQAKRTQRAKPPGSTSSTDAAVPSCEHQNRFAGVAPVNLFTLAAQQPEGRPHCNKVTGVPRRGAVPRGPQLLPPGGAA